MILKFLFFAAKAAQHIRLWQTDFHNKHCLSVCFFVCLFKQFFKRRDRQLSQSDFYINQVFRV